MAKLNLLLLSLAFLAVCHASSIAQTPTPTPSHSPSPSPSPSQAPAPSPSLAPAPAPAPALPRKINELNYTHVCDPRRYDALGLNMSSFGFCDQSLPFPLRAKDLVDRMTLAEKAAQSGNRAKGVPRLGVPPYNWWSEALHGVSDVGGGSNFNGPVKAATSFPLPIVMGASFNETLWKAVGQAVSTEARAMHNLGVAGLTFWSPNINVVRDPRWGRTLETPGEDPLVVGRYAVNYVRGLQDVEGQETAEDLNARPLKVSACCKHYAAYDLDSWRTFGGMAVDRFHYNANVTEQDMVETFLRPFEMCVKEGDVSSVMCSYNEVNGIPTCADARLLRGTIRGDWNLHGYIVSDCDSIETIVTSEKFLDSTPEQGVALGISGGLNLDCMTYYPTYMESAALKGLVKESDIDSALIHNYLVLLRLGWFDGHPMYESLGAADVCSLKNMKLAADAARQGMVLVKNREYHEFYLPLNPDEYKNKTVLVVGPFANATTDMIGNYAGVPCRYVSPIDGLAKYTNVQYERGCEDVFCRDQNFIWPVVRAAKKADAVVIAMGFNLSIEAEGLDRVDFELPGYQNQLISQVAAVAKGPVIVVVFSGGPPNMVPAQENADVDSILWAGFPGQEGGTAIADVIFGRYNPGGRLPVTWYSPDYVWELPMTSMQLRPIDELGYPGRTYKFYNGSVIYPFGHGLSYTTFNYTIVSTQRYVEKKLGLNQHCHMLSYNESAYIPPCPAAVVDDLDCNDDMTVEIQVNNTRKLDGSHVVMLYSRAPDGIVGAPLKQLVGFQRVFVRAGESENVVFKLSSCKALSIVSESAYVLLPEGEHTITVGTEGTDYDVVSFPFRVYLRK